MSNAPIWALLRGLARIVTRTIGMGFPGVNPKKWILLAPISRCGMAYAIAALIGWVGGIGISASCLGVGRCLGWWHGPGREGHAVPELAAVEGGEHFVVDFEEVLYGNLGVRFDAEDVFGWA